MTAFETLLAVQERDTTIDQLRHRRETLPERAAVAEAERELAMLDARRAEVAVVRDEVAGRQGEAEREIAASESRIAEIDKRLYSGEVTASRDLTAMQTEIDHLRSRVSALEDVALAAMDEREPFDAQIAEIDEKRAAVEARLADLRAAIAESEAAIDTEIASEASAREAIAADVPPELLTTYEQLRTKLGGIGAARLEGGRCQGCHLTLPATEIDRLKREPPDALVFCDQCGRILVR